MKDALRQSRSPLYLQIAEILRQNLDRGVWTPGELLPTISELSAEYLGRQDHSKAASCEDPGRRGIAWTRDAGAEQRSCRRRRHGTGYIWARVCPRLSTFYRGDRPALDLLEDRDAEVPGEPLIARTVGQRLSSLCGRTHSRDGRNLLRHLDLLRQGPCLHATRAEFRTPACLACACRFPDDVDVARAPPVPDDWKVRLRTGCLAEPCGWRPCGRGPASHLRWP